MTTLSSPVPATVAPVEFAILADLVSCTPRAAVTLPQLGRLMELIARPGEISTIGGAGGIEHDLDILVGSTQALGHILSGADHCSLRNDEIGRLVLAVSARIDMVAKALLPAAYQKNIDAYGNESD